MFDWFRRLCSRLYNFVRRKKENRSRITVDMSTVGRGFESHRAPGARSGVQIPGRGLRLEVSVDENYRMNVVEKRLNQACLLEKRFIFGSLTTCLFDHKVLYLTDSQNMQLSTFCLDRS